MESPELTCKKIANRMLFVLAEQLHPVHVEFVENGKSMSSLKTANQVTVKILSEKDAERAAESLIKECCNITECIELLLPEHIPGIVITACNISIRVLAEICSDPPRFRADLCYR